MKHSDDIKNTGDNPEAKNMKKQQRPASNEKALSALKAEGYKVRIYHSRQKNGDSLDPKGGATKMVVSKGGTEITTLAKVYYKDSFCRRTGVRVCLDRLENVFVEMKGNI